MGKYQAEDIVRLAAEEDVEFIRLQFTDIFGVLKNVAITVSQLENALHNRCIFDGSVIEGICICIQIWIHLRFFHGDHNKERWHV